MAVNFKDYRIRLRLSQAELGRLAGVPRLHVCLHELGDRRLRPRELSRVLVALQGEAQRLAGVASEIDQQLVTAP